MGSSDTRSMHVFRLPLAGRNDEVGAIRSALRSATRGHGRTVVISGDAGVGKSRLLDETAQLATRAGCAVLHARCTDSGEAVPFELAMQLLSPVQDAENGAALAQTAGDAWTWLLQASPARELATAEQDRLINELHWLLIGRARERPLAIIVDQAEHADDASARALAHLGARLEGASILLAVTLSSQTRGLGARLARDLLATAQAVSLPLLPYDSETAATLVGGVGYEHDQAFVDACTELSGGVPGLLVELLAEVARNQVSSEDATFERLTELSPPGVSRSVSAALAESGDDARRVAEATLVLDEYASAERVARVAGLRETELPAVAERLMVTGVLERTVVDPAKPLRLRAPLVAAALARSCDAGELAEIQLRAVIALRDVAPPDLLEQRLLGRAAAASDEAVAVMLDCAREALARGHPEAALRLVERASSEPPSEQLARAVGLELAAAHAAAGHPDAIARHAGLVDELATPAERSAALEQFGVALASNGRPAEAAAAFERAIAELDPSAGSAVNIRLEVGFAAAATEVPALTDRVRSLLNDRVVDHAQLTPGLAVLAAELLTRNGGPAAQALDLIHWADSHGLAAVDGPGVADVLTLAVAVASWCDDLAYADSLAATLAAPAHAAGTRGATLASAHRSWMHLLQGRIEDAIAAGGAGLSMAGHPGCLYATLVAGRALALARLEVGDRAGAAAAIADARSSNPDADADSFELVEAEGWIALADQEPALAAQRFELAAEVADALGVISPAMSAARIGLVTCLLRTGREAQARDLAAERVDLARRIGADRTLASALRVAARVSELEAALPMLEEAVALVGDSPAGLERARCLLAHGATLRRLNRRSDAGTQLRLALDTATRMGATVLASRARAELLAIGARPRRASVSGADSLTASERRIAELVADGHTNREIAGRLFITTKTVEWHVHNVFLKLNVRNRTELPQVLGRSPGAGNHDAGEQDDAGGRVSVKR